MNKQDCRTLLIVEDNVDLLESYQEILTDEGYQVVTATNGLEALAALEVMDRPCLILLDMFMPVMDGWKFLEHLKLKGGDLVASLPIVICSAAGDVAEEAAKQVRGYIKKPVDLDVLLTMISKFCHIDKK